MEEDGQGEGNFFHVNFSCLRKGLRVGMKWGPFVYRSSERRNSPGFYRKRGEKGKGGSLSRKERKVEWPYVLEPDDKREWGKGI